jgi:hypothetical protein
VNFQNECNAMDGSSKNFEKANTIPNSSLKTQVKWMYEISDMKQMLLSARGSSDREARISEVLAHGQKNHAA